MIFVVELYIYKFICLCVCDLNVIIYIYHIKIIYSKIYQQFYKCLHYILRGNNLISLVYIYIYIYIRHTWLKIKELSFLWSYAIVVGELSRG